MQRSAVTLLSAVFTGTFSWKCAARHLPGKKSMNMNECRQLQPPCPRAAAAQINSLMFLLYLLHGNERTWGTFMLTGTSWALVFIELLRSLSFGPFWDSETRRNIWICLWLCSRISSAFASSELAALELFSEFGRLSCSLVSTGTGVLLVSSLSHC